MCQGLDSGLGQPEVDNQQGAGTPVYAVGDDGQLTNTIVGYSKDCLLPTRLHYYRSFNGESWQQETPSAIKEATGINTGNLRIRIETGTINRFIYALLLPVGNQDQPEHPDLSLWNGKLIYHFKGAIGIGYQQGKARLTRLLRDMRSALEQGFAVAYSSGNETDNHYNILLQEDTALRVKQQFVSRYGKPIYTLGFGDSGGALQQYLLAQNRPGLIQGGVAIVAYPDMTTQTSYGLDCPLLEYYFDHLAADKAFWRSAKHRAYVSGLAHHPTFSARADWLETLGHWLRLETPPQRQGATECNYAWRGSVQLVHNPRFNSHYARYSPKVRATTQWSHWQDNQWIYGTDEHGFAQIPWSNVGVQYGLEAWKQGLISADHFFDLNRKIGSWKPPAQLQPENLWLLSDRPGPRQLLQFSPYQTANFSHDGAALARAPRIPGSLAAAQAAYRSGSVFHGRLPVPIIDVRVYRDDILDIHHSWSAISSRQRILDHSGSNPNQVIWIKQRSKDKDTDRQIRWRALAALEQWLAATDAGAARPDSIQDRCFDADGNTLAEGKSVWNGQWNNQADGHCTQHFPFYQSSRQVAGDSPAASTLFCSRIPLAEAIDRGFYDPISVSGWQSTLESIFPNGVCDYSQPDLAKHR